MSDERETTIANLGGIKVDPPVRVNDPRPSEKVKVEKTQDTPDDFSGIQMSQEEIDGRRKISDFMALPEKERKARHAAVLDRGVMFDRLSVKLPNDLHGEWARNDPLYIDHMRALGFWVDDTYATRRALHSDGSSANIVGDTIFMVTTKDNKSLIDKVASERMLREQRNPKIAPEEAEGKGIVPEEIPTFSESSVREVSASELRDAVSRSLSQTKVQR